MPSVDKGQLLEDVKSALYAAKICSYAQVGVGILLDTIYYWIMGQISALSALIEPFRIIG